MTNATHHFLYIADPMCSWCYGFAPVMTNLANHFQDRLPVRIIVGGLRAGNTRAMRPEDKAYIGNAWTKVGEATGQPFDKAFFERDGFVYDTEPACRAIVTMRRLRPEHALPFMSAISSAFYAGNRDVTSTIELAALAGDFGIDTESFSAELLSATSRNDTFKDFLTAKEMGVEGFPCLAIGSEADGYALVTQGYRPIDGLVEAIENWLTGQPAA